MGKMKDDRDSGHGVIMGIVIASVFWAVLIVFWVIAHK